MYSIFSNGKNISYGIKKYLLDNFEELSTFMPLEAKPGSQVFIIENSKAYILNHNKQWVEIKSNPSSGGGGGTIPPGPSPDEPFYDGGSIDDSDPTKPPHYDGGIV